VFPCIGRIIPSAIFNRKDPIVLGMDVLEGSLRIGTPVCVVTTYSGKPGVEKDKGDRYLAFDGEEEKDGVELNALVLGQVASMQVNHKDQVVVKAGGPSVAVKIQPNADQAYLEVGRHFDPTDCMVYSAITRQSIDVLKQDFKDQMTREDWKLVIKLKKILAVE